MKKLIIILAAVAAILPMAAFANHLDGTWGGYGSNYINFGVGDRSMRYGHSGNVQFVDETGGMVDYHTLRPHHPISLEYEGGRGHEIVRRVIVHRHVRRSHHHHHNDH